MSAWPGCGRIALPKHAMAYAVAHALPAAALKAAGIRYVGEDDVASLISATGSDGLAVPFPGTPAGVVRLFAETAVHKFMAPDGWQPRMYQGPFPPGCKLNWKAIRKDARIKVYWAEGPLKASCLTWRGVPAIAFNGLDYWSKDRVPVADFDAFKWAGRIVVLLVDSDAARKAPAQQSLIRQAEYLESLGATVRVLEVPALDGAAKTDVNDFVAAHGHAALLALPEEIIPADWGSHEATQELNLKHAFLMMDGKATVLTEADDPEFPGTKKISLSQAKDLQLAYRNDLAEYGKDKDDEPVLRSKIEIWFSDPCRREARRLWFKPGEPWGLDPETGDFNLWQGWAVEPHEPDKRHSWRRLRNHIGVVIADGDTALADYVLRWMAHGIQKPATLPEVALAAIGGEGTGKGMLWRSLGRLYGRHFMHLVQKSQLVGNFNDHHKDKLLVYADESFYAGDHQAASALKAMITEPTMMIEPKYVNAYSLPNYRRLVISSNETWVVPADADARRYVVLKVSERRKGDIRYFKAMADELESGGYSAMLHELMHLDISGFDPRRIPQTNALLDQKKLTWDPIVNWWYEALCDGTLGVDPMNQNWEGFCLRSHAVLEITTAAGHRYERRSLETRIGLQLKKLCPLARAERRSDKEGTQSRGYAFPPLAQCRKAFEEFCRTPIDWEREAGLASKQRKSK